MKIRISFLLIYLTQALIVNCQTVQEIEAINKRVNFIESYHYDEGELIEGGFRDTIQTGKYKAVINRVNSKNYRITYMREYAYFRFEITYYVSGNKLIYIRELRCNITYQDCLTEYINRYYFKDDKMIKAQMDKASFDYNENAIQEYLEIFRFLNKDK